MLKGWSPEYISSLLAMHYINDETMRISYESIYEWIYKQYRYENILL